MLIDVSTANVVEIYHLLVGIVTPRPIAWVTTMNSEGLVNLAPFSFFNAFGANPAIVVFSPTLRRDGSQKDTLRNVEATGEFVINSAVESVADAVNLSSSELPPDESEVDLTGLSLLPSAKVRPPRIAESPTQLECKVLQIVSFEEKPIAPNLVIGEVLAIHVREEILDATGRVDPRKLKTIARLGGDWYCRTSDLFAMKRPQ
jgi:flavin reductase (DIM6/NTAB) family NADH-FMN oxidoreductase RutF